VSNFDFSDLLGQLEESPFEEMPVSPEEFVTSPDYLGLPPLSDYQMALVKAGSQIYDRETLDGYLDPEAARMRWEQTYREVIMVLGKGSGKDYCSTIICAYIIYLLLCLKDPQDYYGKPPGDYIDLMNIAINAQQANNVFFKGLKQRLKHSPWFQGKYEPTMNEINFDKSIRLVSGHSKSESLEGYNVMIVILDEISGFDDENTNSTKQVTADSTYKMHRASVTSRFGKRGKLLLLSFPRHRNCYISKKYRDAIAEKEVITKNHTFVIDEDQDAIEGNTFTIEWEEDHITKYAKERTFALKRPSWEVNPRMQIEDYKGDFIEDPADALSRYACMPPESVNAFFKDKEAVESAFVGQNGIDENGQFYEWFVPGEDKEYYVHVDLAQKHDRCVVAMAHVDKWTQKLENDFTRMSSGVKPEVVVDLVKYWTPTSDKMVDFEEVREFIVSLRQRGFNLKLVTFDQYRSEPFIQYLNAINKSERLASGNNQYYTMTDLFMEKRLRAPYLQLAINEYLQLRPNPNNGKIDHPSKGSDDLAVCIAGACFNAVSHTQRAGDAEIEIKTYKEVHKPVPNLEAEVGNNVITAPKSTKYMQSDLREYLTAPARVC
jgi:hypothetical protein